MKETRFFLDADYPLPSEKRYEKNGAEAYLSFFESGDRQPSESWRLDATPDYLYSPKTPQAIRNTLAKVRFIFILREPISRLLSWYRFGQSINQISSELTFDGYVALQRETGDSFPDQHRYPAFAALRHGRYSVYLRQFLDVFGASSIHVLFYEELCRDPLSFMISICRSIGINEAYFPDYSFNILNKSVQVRNPGLHRAYFETKDKLHKLVRHAPGMRAPLRPLRRVVDAVYQRMNVSKSRKVLMSPSTEDFLCSYYEDEPAQLRDLLGIDVRWLERRRSRVT